MARTDASTVKQTFDTDISNSAASDWIARANVLVDRVNNNGTGLSSSELVELETLVAQHFAAAQDPRIESGGSGDHNVSFTGDSGMYFESTQYGQTAVLLDDTGTLTDADDGSGDFTLSYDL